MWQEGANPLKRTIWRCKKKNPNKPKSLANECNRQPIALLTLLLCVLKHGLARWDLEQGCGGGARGSVLLLPVKLRPPWKPGMHGCSSLSTLLLQREKSQCLSWGRGGRGCQRGWGWWDYIQRARKIRCARPSRFESNAFVVWWKGFHSFEWNTLMRGGTPCL